MKSQITNSKFQKTSYCVSGFTLIELLVSIAILGIMAVMVGPGISRAKQDQALTQASEVVKSKLIEAQGLALSPPNGNASYQYYGVIFTDSGSDTNYQISKKEDELVSSSQLPIGSPGVLTNIDVTPGSTWFKIGNSVTLLPASTKIYTVSSGSGSKTVSVNENTGAIGDN